MFGNKCYFWALLTCLCLALTGQSQAHLLNKTDVRISATDTGLNLELSIDLSRELIERDAYYQLSIQPDSLTSTAVQDLLARLGQALVVRIDDQILALDWQFSQFSPAQLDRSDYLNPLVWPMTAIRATAKWPKHTATGGLSVQFNTGFSFEEPIAVSLSAPASATRLSRWLITQQISPRLALTGTTIEVNPRLSANERWHYLGFGFSHILPKGIDHLLFIILLTLNARNIRQSITQLSLFTLAHSVTLVCAVVGVVRAPGAVVEPLIALSILWMALLFLFKNRGDPLRYGLIFGFGLVHGLGFASVLQMQTLPQYGATEALLLFNIGIELAQLLVALSYMSLLAVNQRYTKYPQALKLATAVVAAGLSGFLLITRLST